MQSFPFSNPSSSWNSFLLGLRVAIIFGRGGIFAVGCGSTNFRVLPQLLSNLLRQAIIPSLLITPLDYRTLLCQSIPHFLKVVVVS